MRFTPLTRLVFLMAGVSFLFAGSAQAANKTVIVGHEEFLPPRVAVKPGESVTWDNTAGHDHDQHNVRFEDGSFRDPNPPAPPPWTTSRSFSTEGAYRYYCEVHGAPGGVGMSGIVYVNLAGNVPPVADLDYSPGPVPATGETVSFSSAASEDPDGSITLYEWDLDGNGTFETNTGTTGTATHVYNSAGTRTVKLRVTDDTGVSSETSRTIRVTTPPTAAFTAGPNPATTGQIVSFNAAASGDADGTVTRYQWDLDGNGTYETDTGDVPSAARSYMTPATVNVGLLVTDSDGKTGTTTVAVKVSAPMTAAPTTPPPSSPAPRRPVTPPTPGCSTLSGSARASCLKRECRTVSRRRRAACIQRSCRFVKRGARRAACVRSSCRYVKRGTKRTSCMRKSCRALSGAKKRACVRRYTSRRR